MKREVITAGIVRDAVKSLGSGGGSFGAPDIFLLLDAQTTPEKDIVRSRIGEMFRRGELLRIAQGVYTWNPDFIHPRKSPIRDRLWRFARKTSPGWTAKQAALIARCCESMAMRYCGWLEEKGYIEVMGRKGTSRLFRATALAAKTPETPQPPTEETDPFEKEKKAAGRIINLMLTGNLDRAKTQAEIAQHCRAILARFCRQDEKITQNEKITQLEKTEVE